jgi:hypothetical protein
MTNIKNALRGLCDKACSDAFKPITLRVAALAEDLLADEHVGYIQLLLVSSHVNELLDVLKPTLKNDISLLRELSQILMDWHAELKYVDRILSLETEAR